jgi:hypothetical protein
LDLVGQGLVEVNTRSAGTDVLAARFFHFAVTLFTSGIALIWHGVPMARCRVRQIGYHPRDFIMTYFTSALTGVAMLCAMSASASTIQDMPNQYFDSIAAKLIMAGYRDIQMVDQNAYKLSAFDRDGSEVLIVMHPSSRQILRQSFVHSSDE